MTTNFKNSEPQEIHGGNQWLLFFDNGYGASIVSHQYSYGGKSGLYEVAVLRGNENNWSITYDTPITSDVIGHLDEDEVNDVIHQIEFLQD